MQAAIDVPLQWGRDQMIAELAAYPTILLSMICGTPSERL